MTLRVKKIVHVEKSLYQDVLVFESTDHGNVLVLDGAIQVSRLCRSVKETAAN
jgi:spermidine synthase